MIRRILLAIGVLTACFSYLFAQTPLRMHEYWIDDNYDQHVVVSSANANQQYQIDLSSLTIGVHYFNHRSQNTDGEWGAMVRKVFYLGQYTENKEESISPLVGYEYWLDDDYANKVTVSSTDGTTNIIVDLSDLTDGTHYFNYRAVNADGRWGALTRKVFYAKAVGNESEDAISPPAGYEYWLDDDYINKVTVSSTDGSANIVVDLSDLTDGTHYFNYRAVNADGRWGALTRKVFYAKAVGNESEEGVSPLAGYEYWLDDDYDNRVYKKSSLGNIVASVPLDGLKSGVHCFNFRSHNEAGVWGAMTRNIFYLPVTNVQTDEGAKIIGYRYKFNANTTYVGIEPCNEYELNNKIITIPEYNEFASLDEGCKYEFTPNNIRLTRENSSVFSLQFENENHKWSNPASLEISVRDTLDRRVIELPVQSSVTLNKVPSGDFNALRLNITETNNYYFKATQPCRIDLYTEGGKLYQTFENNQIVKLCEAGLIEGTYYGIVRDHKTDSIYTDSDVTIRMLLTEGLTPDPVISFADSLLTITAMDGAKIYYTLDGSKPSTNSDVYTQPIKLDKNYTVKAIAKHPDLAISDVTTYKVDFYKVALPEVQFANLKLYMTCSTPDAKLYYTVDGRDPSLSGTLYTGPVTLDHNCTVKVVGKRNGYNDSDMLSYILDLESVKCTDPQFSLDGNILTLSCLTEDVTFYFTLDGTDPTSSYERYTGPITLTHNGEVKAYATKEGLLNSETVSFIVDWFQAELPVFDIVDNKIVIMCSTERAEIRYTIDGSIPDLSSEIYDKPIDMTQGIVVKAIAYAKNFNPSEVASFDPENLRCMIPTFSINGNRLSITSKTENAVIYYTLDGSAPTHTSTLYADGINLVHNGIVKAVATKKGYADSSVAEFTVDWFIAESPVINVEGNVVTISCPMPNAEIFYSLGGAMPDRTSQKYNAPFEIFDNKTIKAIAYVEHFKESTISEYHPDIFTVGPIDLKYDGRYVTLENATPNVTIHYTLNGSTPTLASDVYTSPIDVKGLTMVKAMAFKTDYNSSDLTSFIPEVYFDGETLLTSKYGVLTDAFGWCKTEDIARLNVIGLLNGNDLSILAAMPSLAHLDIEESEIEGGLLPSNLFAGSNLVSVSLPRTIESVGSGLFSGCRSLGAIKWNSTRPLTSLAMSGFQNPNLLLYVRINSLAPSSIKNVVSSGYAESITLVDGEGNTNFYCSQEFTAKHIEYRHNYPQETVKNACAGWETLSLPFDVQTITHATKGALAPFAANNPDAKPFWLCTLGSNGFVDASEIIANTPYIISMPNNMDYADDYILGGDVTFSADNVVVPTTKANEASRNEFVFSPTTANVPKDLNIYALNVGERYEGFLPGSTFVGDYRDVRPFEAYLTTTTHSTPRMMSIARLGFEDEALLEDFMTANRVFEVRGENGRIFINTASQLHVDVYSSLGALVRSEDVAEGVSYIEDLPTGVYFVNGQKVMVR